MHEPLPLGTRLVGAAIVVAVLSAAVWSFVALAGTAPSASSIDLLELPAPATRHGERKLLVDVAGGGPGLVAVGEFGLLLGSSDQGRSWRQLASPTAVMLTGVHFVDVLHGWAVGHDGVVLSTTDGGATWQRRFDGRQANDAMLRAAKGMAEKAEAAKGDAAQAQRDRAADALAAAEDAVKAGPSRPLLSVRFIDARRGFVAGAFGQLFATPDGGASWQYLGDRLDNPEGLHLNSLSVTPQGELFIAAEMGQVFRSTDQGASWQRADTGYNGHLYGVLALPAREGAGTLLAYGFNGHLFRSRDRGVTWMALPAPGPKTLVQGAVRGGAALLLAEDGRLFASRDEGEHFTPVGDRLAQRRLAGFAMVGDTLVAVGEGGVSSHALEPEGVNR